MTDPGSQCRVTVDGRERTLEDFRAVADRLAEGLPEADRDDARELLAELGLMLAFGNPVEALYRAAALGELASGGDTLRGFLEEVLPAAKREVVRFAGVDVVCRPQEANFLRLFADDCTSRSIHDVLREVWNARRWDAAARNRYGKLQSIINGRLAEAGIRDVFSLDGDTVRRYCASQR